MHDRLTRLGIWDFGFGIWDFGFRPRGFKSVELVHKIALPIELKKGAFAIEKQRPSCNQKDFHFLFVARERLSDGLTSVFNP